VQNAFIESFNGTFYRERLNLDCSYRFTDAKRTISAFRQDYNVVRPCFGQEVIVLNL
jgi:hypothetical protein